MNNDALHDLEGSWVVSSLGGQGDPLPSAPQVITTLTLRDGEASGNGGVNRFGVRYEVGPEGEVSFGRIASTRMAGPAAAMTREAEFFAALEATRRVDIRDGRLTLLGADDMPLLALTPSPSD